MGWGSWRAHVDDLVLMRRAAAGLHGGLRRAVNGWCAHAEERHQMLSLMRRGTSGIVVASQPRVSNVG